MRSAPHRRHRLPGQPEEGRRPAGAAVLRDGRRRRAARASRRSGGWRPRFRPARCVARARSAGQALSGPARRWRNRRWRSSDASTSAAVKAVLGDLERCTPEDGRAAGLHRSRRGQRVQSRGDGRRVQRVTSRAATHGDINALARFVARHDRPHAVAAARASGQRSRRASRSTRRRSSRTRADR